MIEVGKTVTVGSLFVLFLGIIVVLSFLPEIASGQQKMTSYLPYYNDTQTLTNCYATGTAGEVNTSNSNCNITLTGEVPSGWNVANCPLDSLTVKNVNGTVLALSTDYTVNTATGVVSYLNTTATENDGLGGTINQTYVSYNYCDDGYISSSAGRGIARLITIFAALGLVAFAIYYGVKSFF